MRKFLVVSFDVYEFTMQVFKVYLKDKVSIEGSSKGLLSARNRARNALIFVAEDNELFPISVKELR